MRASALPGWRAHRAERESASSGATLSAYDPNGADEPTSSTPVSATLSSPPRLAPSPSAQPKAPRPSEAARGGVTTTAMSYVSLRCSRAGPYAPSDPSSRVGQSEQSSLLRQGSALAPAPRRGRRSPAAP